jgi:hypothetical protein
LASGGCMFGVFIPKLCNLCSQFAFDVCFYFGCLISPEAEKCETIPCVPEKLNALSSPVCSNFTDSASILLVAKLLLKFAGLQVDHLSF